MYTGTEVGADTDASVYVNLFGEFGDTGKRLMNRSDKKVMFQEGQVCITKWYFQASYFIQGLSFRKP